MSLHDMNIAMSDINKNFKGDERKVGFEIEYSEIEISDASNCVKNLFGGDIKVNSDIEHEIKNTKFGDFKIELDAIPIKNLVEKKHGLDKTKLSDKIDIEISDAITNASKEIVPFEIVSPPIMLSDFAEFEKLVDGLRALGAKGSKDGFYYAFGLHINPEVTSLDADYTKKHLQSFLLLYDFLLEKHEIDWARRVTNYIDPFPDSYLKLILDKNYNPDMPKLIEDYHSHNPTRNRALDMLPLFSHINEKLVRKLYGDEEKINKRPTFHYRLPNSDIGKSDWSVTKEYNIWLNVENIANDENKLNELIEKWQEREDSWFSDKSKWVKEVKKVI